MDYTQEELDKEYQDVLEECPEYSEYGSYQYDLDWCMTLAMERLKRRKEEEEES